MAKTCCRALFAASGKSLQRKTEIAESLGNFCASICEMYTAARMAITSYEIINESKSSEDNHVVAEPDWKTFEGQLTDIGLIARLCVSKMVPFFDRLIQIKLNELMQAKNGDISRIVLLDQLGWLVIITIFLLCDNSKNATRSNEWITVTIPKLINRYSEQISKTKKPEETDPVVSLIASIFNVIQYESQCLQSGRVTNSNFFFAEFEFFFERLIL